MSNGMEPDVRKYLWKIVYSLFFGLLWLFSNSIIGIYFGYGIIEGKPSLGNFLFYTWLAGSLAALLWYYYLIWKN
jgi:hypothetical protein